MDKRKFLTAMLGAAGLLGARVNAEGADRVLTAGGMDFRWSHRDGRLHGTLSAPTGGWIAVGFNDQRGLKGTRFVIAAVSGGVRAEEHIALVPDHKSVEDMGLAPALGDLRGQYAFSSSLIEFSLPHDFPDQPDLSLAPGTETHLMLAWSWHADFDHHSAWRRHFDITL